MNLTKAPFMFELMNYRTLKALSSLSKNYKKEANNVIKRMNNQKKFINLINARMRQEKIIALAKKKNKSPENEMSSLKKAKRRAYFSTYKASKHMKEALNRIEKGASVKKEYRTFLKKLGTEEKKVEGMKRFKKPKKT